MSLLVTRRKSRRKLPHQPKNLDVLHNPQSSYSINKSKQHGANYYAEVSRKHSDHTSHRRYDRHRSGSPVTSSSSATLLSATNSTKGVGIFPQDELDLEFISFRVGKITYDMDNMGNWTSSTSLVLGEGGGGSRGSFPLDFKASIAELNDANKKIAQENNLLRVKNEVLADMIARKTLRKHKLETELKRLRKLLSNSSSRFSITSEK